ncbi:hypothetical protein GCM10008938_09560 [Deinococcus roseus]|uniref:BIG2 domain-containing protein n=1 Tax=Deinococcus roseus TaxID=392414 RepID=A0ABQ2CX55_9DEIO|nr:hypothetical protein GCM10008938_09560 [Deinococcus roseus]
MTAVSVNPTVLQISTGQSETLDVNVTATGNVDQSVTWSSTNSSVVVVDASGNVTALKAGTATVTATSKQNPSKKGTSSITVQDASVVTSVSIAPDTLDLQVGSTQTLNASVSGSGNFDHAVSWSSSDSSVATVNASGQVKGLKEGTVLISATSVLNATQTGMATVHIKKPSSADAFNITLVFPAGTKLTTTQKQAFTDAANRWSQVITEGLADFNGTAGDQILNVDDLQITADAIDIDGPGKILGQAGPEFIRDENGLPITGLMRFDSADMASMEAKGTLKNVILHEMGHVLGIGTLWDKFIIQNGTPKCQTATSIFFNGARAVMQYKALGKTGNVPVENSGGAGTKCGHWSESTFDSELMTGFAENGAMPLSKLTVGALEDLGYQVSYSAADAFVMPALLQNIQKEDLDHGEILLGPRGRL